METQDSSVKKRIRTGFFIGVIIAAVLLTSHIPVVITAFVLLLNTAAAYEILKAAYFRPDNKMTAIIILSGLLIISIPLPGYIKFLPYVYVAATLKFLRIMRRIGRYHADVPIQLFIICTFIALFFKAIPTLRKLEQGFFYLLAAILCGCMTDIFAYTVGKKFGKHKLAPTVSPNKTIEGSIGGIAGSVITLLLMGFFLHMQEITVVHFGKLLLYAVTGSVVGQFGDLSMSAIKRCLYVKDFGNLLPGHGGILDRFDSLLFIAPYSLLFCRYAGPFFL